MGTPPLQLQVPIDLEPSLSYSLSLSLSLSLTVPIPLIQQPRSVDVYSQRISRATVVTQQTLEFMQSPIISPTAGLSKYIPG